MINHPTTPPMTQMSTVMRLMGIGGETTRFVRNKSTTPTTPFAPSPTNPASVSISVVRKPKINNATINTPTTMSTSNSMRHYFRQRPDCLPANKRVGDELPLYSELPRTVLLGNRASGIPISRKHRGQKEPKLVSSSG